jgi:hypothetical protein
VENSLPAPASDVNNVNNPLNTVEVVPKLSQQSASTRLVFPKKSHQAERNRSGLAVGCDWKLKNTGNKLPVPPMSIEELRLE